MPGKSKNNTKAAINLMRRKLVAGLNEAAATAARLYAADVSETIGERPIPLPAQGPPGNPYRSEPGQYPFVQPETPEGWHGFEYIAYGVDAESLRSRSGLKEDGMHLFALSHDPEFTGAYGARKGMDQSYVEHRSAIARAFTAVAEATK